MAQIYIGRSTGIGAFERHVVLKVITAERANDTVAVQMFLDEARLAASLNHQNVAQVFEVGEDAGIHYLAMEYVHGQDLRALLAKAGTTGTRIPLDLALTVVAGAAAGLHHAHERRGPDGVPLGIVHRDVSPSNIMVGYDGSVKLLDFGIAKAAARSVETQAGIIKGKFAYMAPEQCRGREVDRRSDVFSLGIILYEVTTQHRCFRADSDFDTMHRIVTGDVVRPTRIVQGYPAALEAIVMKALAVDANQRYQSAGALLEALESFAATARVSLSTMSLGRFMRDMFGDMPEPWLVNASRATPMPPKENTISQTGDSSGPVVLAAQGSDSERMDAAATVLEMSRDLDAPEPQVAWNARAYPGEAPIASPDAPQLARASHPNIVPVDSRLRRTPPQGSQQPIALTQPPAGTQPLPPSNAFALAPGSASSSKPALASPGFGGTGESSDLSYPRYSGTGDAIDVRVRPSRRYWVIGGLMIVIGAVAAALVGGGHRSDQPATTGDGTGSAVAPAPATPTPPSVPVNAPSAQPENDAMITVHVDSIPSGADVLIAGTKVGTTPFDKKLRRGKTVAPLTLRRPGYLDYTAKVDFSDDFSAELQLKEVPPAGGEGSGAVPTIPPASPSGAASPGSGSSGSAPSEPVVKAPASEHRPATSSSKSERHVQNPVRASSSSSSSPSSSPPPSKAKCQLPGPNMDPFSGLPACKPGEKP